MTESEEQSPSSPILEQSHINFHNTRQAIEKEIAPSKLKIKDPEFISTVDEKRSKESIDRITELQAKIRHAKAHHLKLVSIVKFRLAADQIDEKPASNTQLLVLAAEYLGERGFTDASNRLFKLNPEIQDFVDTDMIMEEVRLENEINNGQLEGASRWCHDHRSSSKKCDPSLQFELQKQKFRQLGTIDIEKALEFAKETFKKVNPLHYPELSYEMRALYRDDEYPFTEKPKIKKEPWAPRPQVQKPTRDSLTKEDLASSSNRFRRTLRQVYQRPARNMSVNYALLGLSVIKTRRCASAHPDSSTLENSDSQEALDFYDKELEETKCPACNPDYLPLAEVVPASSHTYSKLDSDMFVFPQSNSLMGRSRILEYVETNADNAEINPNTVVHDPCVSRNCQWSEMIRAYAL